MKEFLRDILIEPFKEGYWVGYIIGSFIWVLLIILIIGLIIFSLYFIDSSFLPIKKGEGIITGKNIVSKHQTTTYINAGKIIVPMTNYYPTEYRLKITINNLSDEVSVNQDYWNAVKIGDTVYCDYVNGRIFKSIYIKHF